MKVVNAEDIGEFPVSAQEIKKKFGRVCESSRKRLIEEWLAEVAELFLDKKSAWSCYFEKKPGASTMMIEKYFTSINSLLSRQLRFIVLETLDHLRNVLVQYAGGNYFLGEYSDSNFSR